jgi:hypothetical protein
MERNLPLDNKKGTEIKSTKEELYFQRNILKATTSDYTKSIDDFLNCKKPKIILISTNKNI